MVSGCCTDSHIVNLNGCGFMLNVYGCWCMYILYNGEHINEFIKLTVWFCMSPSAPSIYTEESAVYSSDTPPLVTHWVALTEDTGEYKLKVYTSHN